MAASNYLLATLLIFLTILHLGAGFDEVIRDVIDHDPMQVHATIDCNASCDARCKLSSRPNLCKRACGTCCARCDCVPPGTSGNYDVCPCYRDMTTHGGKRKCP